VSEVDPDKAPQQPKGNDAVAAQDPVKKEPKDAKDAPKAPPPKTPPAASSDSGKGAKGLAGIALVVGLAGLAAGGYSIWQTQQSAEQASQQLEATQGAREQTRQLEERSQQLASRLGRLEQLPSADQLEERRRLLAELQSDQQRLSGRVEQVLGASREQWRLAEAEHLLRMAMLRLSAMEDVNSAESLIAEADLILRKQDDPGAYGTRQRLLEGLEALRSLPELDRTGLFLQLGALRGQANQLSGLAPEFENGASQSDAQGESGWKQWLNELTRYVRIDFNAGTDVKPLLAGQSLAQVRLALSLAIEQAQWAVLNSNEEIYRQSLDQASRLIGDHFSEENGQSRGLRDRIEELAERQVSVTLPDLAPALQAMQTYVQKRESAESSEGGEGESADRGQGDEQNSNEQKSSEQKGAGEQNGSAQEEGEQSSQQSNEPAGEAEQPAEAEQTDQGGLRT
jgi:uroporphyrin-III C-methyltransferase